MSDVPRRLSGLWGIHQLAMATGWSAKLLSSEPTERHRCYVRTPGGHSVWVECEEPRGFDFSRPLRSSYWRPCRLLTGLLPKRGSEALVSTSFYEYEIPFLQSTERESFLSVRKEGAKGFGSEVELMLERLGPSEATTIELVTERGKVAVGDGYLLLVSGTAKVRLEALRSCRLALGRSLLALMCDGSVTAVIESKRGSVWLPCPKEMTLSLEPEPSRARWMQPFALVEDFIDVGEEVSSSYLEIPIGEDKICLISRSPMSVSLEKRGGLALYSSRSEPLALALLRGWDLSAVGLWVSLLSRPLEGLEVPLLRLAPPILVPHEVKVSWEEGLWHLGITLSNPHPREVEALLTVERPFYLVEVRLNGEDLTIARTNSVDLFLSGYSAFKVDMLLRKGRLAVARDVHSLRP